MLRRQVSLSTYFMTSSGSMPPVALLAGTTPEFPASLVAIVLHRIMGGRVLQGRCDRVGSPFHIFHDAPTAWYIAWEAESSVTSAPLFAPNTTSRISFVPSFT
mgnify:CR=1 FL=1